MSIYQKLVNQLTHQSYKLFNQCVICHQLTAEHPSLCQHCYALLPCFDYQLLSGDLLNRPEFNRIYQKRHFDQLISLAPYQYPFSVWLSKYKYQRALELSTLLGHLLSTRLSQLVHQELLPMPDFICVVPLHIKKWQRRGFNQSTSLAQHCAKTLNVPFADDIVTRNHDTKAQAELSGKDRRKNLKNAFKANNTCDLSNKHLLLIDDVVTTGSTANEISRILKRAGIKKVTLATLCISY